MQIAYHPKAQSGVTELMYVGDDGLPVSPPLSTYQKWIIWGALAALAWMVVRKK